MKTSSYAFLTSVLFSLPVLAASQTEVNRIVAKVCSSSLPVLVVDNFMSSEVKPYIDINGDEIPDVAHGELVSSFLQASGKKTIPHNLSGGANFEETAESLKPILKQIKEGTLKIAAINVSQIADAQIERMMKEFKIDVTAEGLLNHKTAIHNRMRAAMDAEQMYSFGHLSDVFSEFEKLHIPIFVAGGNKGPEHMNVYSLLPGVISVGSKAIDGTPSATSAQNGLIQVTRFGEHVLRRTQDGRIDVNNDGVAEFNGIQLSTGPNIVDQYAGKPLSQLLRALPDNDVIPLIDRQNPDGLKLLMSELVDGVYKTEDLISYFKLESHAFAKAMMKRAPYHHKSQNIGFDVDASGRLVFDPAHDGTQNQVLLVGGTSYATPSICAK